MGDIRIRTVQDVRTSRSTPVLRAAREIGLIGVLYVGYTVTRMFAEDDLAPAKARAHGLLHIEHVFGLDWEFGLNHLFAHVDLFGLIGSYWYATGHYLVTLTALIWLYRKGQRTYVTARRALVLASLIALVIYLLLPMAPPRMMPGYLDVLDLHSAEGWWGGDASAPKGFGDWTNELAAFPSLHAGWAVWVAIVVRRVTTSQMLRGLAWFHAFMTSLVIIGTGNHWVLDAVVGWLIVLFALWMVDIWAGERRGFFSLRPPGEPAPS
ncbi:MAG: phosphatase PAP2 family protein [Nocardioides sp.]